MTQQKEAIELFRQFGLRYGPAAGENGPVLLVQEVFGVEPDDWQHEALKAYGRGERGISIASAHGVGKTALASWCSWHSLLTRYPQKTVVTAPSSSQLEDALLVEIKKWHLKLPKLLADLFDISTDRIVLKANPAESFLSARTSRAERPEALQGIHCDPGYVLLIADEASGIPQAVYNAAQGSMSGHNVTTLLIGNPTRTSGKFFDTHHHLSDEWFTLTVGYQDSTRVSAEFVESVAKEHGRDSNEFRVRCLGLFPLSDADSVIPWDYVYTAKGRDVAEADNAARVWGLDVARFGSDRSALVERTRRKVTTIESWQGLDLMQLTGKIVHKWNDTPDHLRPRAILVDSIGLGSGVLDRLRELGLPARGVNTAEVASSSERFNRLRDELWWKVREWLEGRDVALPVDNLESDPNTDPPRVLAKELTYPTYDTASNGKIKVEPKSETKKRLKRSPDLADALMLTFAEDSIAMMFGSAGGTSWNEPVYRDIPVT